MTNPSIPSLDAPYYEPASGGAPKQLIVFLHGYGADGQDLISLAPIFAEHFPDAAFASPNAPYPCEMAPWGRQWFSLLDRSPAALRAGAASAEPILNHFLDDILARFELPASKLALVGFSQGTMMSLYAAPRRSENIAGVVGYSGVINPDALQPHDVRSTPPVCLIHGDQDEVVPYASLSISADTLRDVGISAEEHTRHNLGHGIDEQGITIAIDFLKKSLV
jgi:phospholipase/carboxylesterase